MIDEWMMDDSNHHSGQCSYAKISAYRAPSFPNLFTMLSKLMLILSQYILVIMFTLSLWLTIDYQWVD